MKPSTFQDFEGARYLVCACGCAKWWVTETEELICDRCGEARQHADAEDEDDEEVLGRVAGREIYHRRQPGLPRRALCGADLEPSTFLYADEVGTARRCLSCEGKAAAAAEGRPA